MSNEDRDRDGDLLKTEFIPAVRSERSLFDSVVIFND